MSAELQVRTWVLLQAGPAARHRVFLQFLPALVRVRLLQVRRLLGQPQQEAAVLEVVEAVVHAEALVGVAADRPVRLVEAERLPLVPRLRLLRLAEEAVEGAAQPRVRNNSSDPS